MSTIKTRSGGKGMEFTDSKGRRGRSKCKLKVLIGKLIGFEKKNKKKN